MPIDLPTTTTSLLPEYAVTSWAISQTMVQDANGHYQPQFSASVAYSRIDFIVDGNGNKTSIASRAPFVPTPPAQEQPWPQDPYQGSFAMNNADLQPYIVGTTPYFTAIQLDTLMRADMVKRGILAS